MAGHRTKPLPPPTSGRGASLGLAGLLGRFLRYAWGVLAHPRPTFDQPAEEHSLRWAVLVATFGALQVWGNMVLFAAFSLNMLITTTFAR